MVNKPTTAPKLLLPATAQSPPGSGVDDAMVCAVPRDVGARVMAVSAVVATAVLLAQAWLPVRSAA